MKAGLSYTQAWGANAAEFQLIRYPSMMKVFFFFFLNDTTVKTFQRKKKKNPCCMPAYCKCARNHMRELDKRRVEYNWLKQKSKFKHTRI